MNIIELIQGLHSGVQLTLLLLVLAAGSVTFRGWGQL